jgi:hypothetical protein
MTSTQEGRKVLDGSVHSVTCSRELVSFSRSLKAASLSLCAPPANASDRNIRRRQRFGRFCAFKVTCRRQPVSFSRLLYALSPSLSLSLCVPPAFVCTGHKVRIFSGLPLHAKVKMSRYTPCRRQGGEEILLIFILYLGTRWGWVVSVTLRPRFTFGKGGRSGGQSWCGHRGYRKNPLLLPGIEAQSLSSLSSPPQTSAQRSYDLTTAFSVYRLK